MRTGPISTGLVTAAMSAGLGLALLLSGCQFSAKVGNLDTSTVGGRAARGSQG